MLLRSRISIRDARNAKEMLLVETQAHMQRLEAELNKKEDAITEVGTAVELDKGETALELEKAEGLDKEENVEQLEKENTAAELEKVETVEELEKEENVEKLEETAVKLDEEENIMELDKDEKAEDWDREEKAVELENAEELDKEENVEELEKENTAAGLEKEETIEELEKEENVEGLEETAVKLDKEGIVMELDKDEKAEESDKEGKAVESEKRETSEKLHKEENTEESDKEENAVELGKEESDVVQNQKQLDSKPPLDITVGLELPLRDLKRKLLKDGVSMLVITALGGCGKTTLARQFCKDEHVKVKFKNNIFFVTVSKKPNLEHIVEHLYQQKGSQMPDLDGEPEHLLRQFIEETGQNPLLLVLDDVWSGSEYLLEMFEEFKMLNSKILVTSRFEFLGFGDPFYLKSLDEDDATKLFRHSASLGDDESYIPEDLLEQIVERCKGFPIAITVVGRSLRGKPIDIWRQRVDQLSKGSSIIDSEVDLLNRLQSSLDALDKEKAIIKDCFLDLGLFPEETEIPAAALVDMWTELYQLGDDIRSIENLRELNTRSVANLIVRRKDKMEADGYYSEHSVSMHDMLKDLALYHIKRGPLEDRKRLLINKPGDKLPKWLREQKNQPINARLVSIKNQPVNARLVSITSDGVFSTEWNSIELPKTEVMVFNFRKGNSAVPEFLEKVDKLKVLIVHNNSSSPAELSSFQLLGSLPNLQRIRLKGISVASIINAPAKLKSLQKISLFMCSIGQAFSNCSIQVSDVFPVLVEMNIESCIDLVDFPAKLCDLIRLKKLSITNCHKLSALPEEIQKLVNLEVLRLRSCTDLVALPNSITKLEKLEFLDISSCVNIMELPKDIDELSSLRKFSMMQCSRLQPLPPSIVDLEQLKDVICDEVTEKLWEPFQLRLKNIYINVVKDDTGTTVSQDSHAITRKNREVIGETVKGGQHAEFTAQIKGVKAEMKEIRANTKALKDELKALKDELKALKDELKALKDEFSPFKTQLDVIVDLLVQLKQEKK